MDQESLNWIFVCNESEIEMNDLKRFDYKNKTYIRKIPRINVLQI